MDSFRIGDKVYITNLKHKKYGKTATITKVNKNTVKIHIKYTDKLKKSFTIDKKDVMIVLQEFLSDNSIQVLSGKSFKKVNIIRYIAKAFPRETFDDFALINYMRTRRFNYVMGLLGSDPFPWNKVTSKELLDMKIKQKKIVSTETNPCIFFTPILTRKFLDKYHYHNL